MAGFAILEQSEDSALGLSGHVCWRETVLEQSHIYVEDQVT